MNQDGLLSRALAGIAGMALLLASAAAFAAVGEVVFVAGDASVQRAGAVLGLTKGDPVEAGDVITTGASGRVQFGMSNGDFFSLRPNTIFRIDQPSDSVAGGDGRSLYSLLRGGYRSMTRLLSGERPRTGHQVRTVVALIGIRGTDYAARLCGGDCELNQGGGVTDGLYLGVWEGGVSVANKADSLNLDPNEYSFVPSFELAPQRLSEPPAILLEGLASGGDGSLGTRLATRSSPGNAERGRPNEPYGPDQRLSDRDGNDLTAGMLLAEEPPPPEPPPPEPGPLDFLLGPIGDLIGQDLRQPQSP